MKKFFNWIIIPAGVFWGTYGVLWNLAEPFGLTTGTLLFFKLIALSLIITVIYILSKVIYNFKKEIYNLKISIFDSEVTTRELRNQLDVTNQNKSTCCVVQQTSSKCPVGIISINERASETIESSLLEAKKSFKWYGLSAFNVVHNHKDLFSSKKDVSFEFVISNPANSKLGQVNDTFYNDTVGRLSSESLITKSDEILKDIKNTVHRNLKIKYHNQIPTFRIILVDDKKVYVSAYEPGKDALQTTQIVIEEGLAKSIYNWFEVFYTKSLLNEELSQTNV